MFGGRLAVVEFWVHFSSGGQLDPRTPSIAERDVEINRGVDFRDRRWQAVRRDRVARDVEGFSARSWATDRFSGHR